MARTRATTYRNRYRNDYQGHQPARFFGSAGEFVFWDAPSPPPACACCLRAVTSASSSCTRTWASSRNLSWARCCCHVRKPCEKKQDRVRLSYRTCVGPRERGSKEGKDARCRRPNRGARRGSCPRRNLCRIGHGASAVAGSLRSSLGDGRGRGRGWVLECGIVLGAIDERGGGWTRVRYVTETSLWWCCGHARACGPPRVVRDVDDGRPSSKMGEVAECSARETQAESGQKADSRGHVGSGRRFAGQIGRAHV